MEHYPDFLELFRSLNARGVEYVIVGGYAMSHHDQPRYTKDIDIFVQANPENATRVMQALRDYGVPLDFTEEDFSKPRFFFRIGRAPVQIDLLTEIHGVTWNEVWAGRSPGHYGDEPVQYIGREQLIKNKRAAGRPRDLADIADLGGDV